MERPALASLYKTRAVQSRAPAFCTSRLASDTRSRHFRRHSPRVWLVTQGGAREIVRLSAQVTLAGIDPSRDQRVQQLLRAGRLDEIELSVVPFLLGGGVRLFEHLDHPIELRQTGVIESSGVTHLRFRVLHA
jgi:hypothetical protein